MIGVSFSGSSSSSVADGGAMMSNSNFSSHHRNIRYELYSITLFQYDCFVHRGPIPNTSIARCIFREQNHPIMFSHPVTRAD